MSHTIDQTSVPTHETGVDDAGPSRMHQFFERTADRYPDHAALECGDEELTYSELDARANQLAHLIETKGVEPEDRVAVLLERSTFTYVAILGVMKAGAVFVPIDPGAPADRIEYITSDAGVSLIVTTSDFRDRIESSGVPALHLDERGEDLRGQPKTRPSLPDAASDPAAYIIYTSGSTGKPKGVEIAQSSITNFLSVVPTVYDVRPDDRVYQGMTISFDFSIEEIWPTWCHGATLVAGPTDSRRLGADLAAFLEDRRISVMYCVPTLLATIPDVIDRLRSILVGGEACPRELVERWASPHRRILNTYGPTEATITATWCELKPGRTVTIGKPLPTYDILILDHEDTSRTEPLRDGAVGEICIGGVGVARRYVNRPELTAERFISHPLDADRRLYRTGDLGRILEDGEIEYLGRADSEVKVRGHRVDLGEIESVLLEDDDVAVAAVDKHPDTGPEVLVGYISLSTSARERVSSGDDAVLAEIRARLHADARGKLPDYMVPTFLDVLDEVPTAPSGKTDRKRLPSPSTRFAATDPSDIVAPSSEAETRIRDVWADNLSIPADELSVTANFFDELGGHSLAAARIVSELRESSEGASVGVRDLYSWPTVREFTAHIESSQDSAVRVPPRHEPATHSSARVWRAGLVQAAFILALFLIVTTPVAVIYWRHDGQPSTEVLIELLIATIPTYLGTRWILPLALTRLLSRNIDPGRYRLWGRTYLRLWMIDRLITISPLPVLAGSSFMPAFLRALGAQVGKNSHIGTSMIALPRMITIGDRASVGYNTTLRPWRVEDGWVIVSPITIGDRVFVGANSSLDTGVELGDDVLVAEQSAVGVESELPANTRWRGSPAAEVPSLGATTEELHAMSPAPGPRFGIHAATMLGLIGLEATAILTLIPALIAVWWVLLRFGMLAALLFTPLTGIVYVASVCFFVAVGKRLVLPRSRTGVYSQWSIAGVRRWYVDALFEMSLRFSNSLYATLYTVPWLRLLGARIGRNAEVSTAAHIVPDLLDIGDGAFVADMTSIGGPIYCNGFVSCESAKIGERSFIGNAAIVPGGTSTGDDSLVGVLTIPPEEGVPSGSSWLGSPAMHLPARQHSGDFDDKMLFSPSRSRVAHRLLVEFFRITMPAGIIGMSLFIYLWGLSLIARSASLWLTIICSPVIALVTAIGVFAYVAMCKSNIVGDYRARTAPLWDTFVRRTEFVTGLYEAAAVPVLLGQLAGTPFLPVALRVLGAQVGKRTYIDTTFLTEFDLVVLGDDSAVGNSVSLQTHLFEDRVMKMSEVRIGEGASVGSRSIVLYDAALDKNARLSAMSLAMKGETLPEGSSWQGIPAQAGAA